MRPALHLGPGLAGTSTDIDQANKQRDRGRGMLALLWFWKWKWLPRKNLSTEASVWRSKLSVKLDVGAGDFESETSLLWDWKDRRRRTRPRPLRRLHRLLAVSWTCGEDLARSEADAAARPVKSFFLERIEATPDVDRFAFQDGRFGHGFVRASRRRSNARPAGVSSSTVAA